MRNRAFLILCLLLILPATALAADPILQVERPQDIPSFLGYVPDEFIVVLKPDAGLLDVLYTPEGVAHVGEAGFDMISDRFATSRIKQQFPGAQDVELARYHKVRFADGTLEEAMAEYANHPFVESVEPIGIHAMYATPNDGYFQYQTYHHQANDHDIDSPEAWDIQTGSSSIIVALLDSGTRYYHPDLGGVNASPSNPGAARGNMWINWAEQNGSPGVDDDGNGYTDDWIGYDFIDGVSNCWSGEDCNTKDNDPRDFNGHGTHTAGIMAMLTNDGYGMAGVGGGWGNGSQAETGNGIRVMALRMGYSYNYFGQEYGVVTMDAAAEAFYYAANNGAHIASCSWGSSNSGGIGTAVTYFLNSGGIVFVAAGNDGGQTADYLNGRGDCISVSAVDENDAAASFTTYGTWVDICAPGVNIYSTYHDHTDPNTNYWASMSGTSMATPMAAAVGALIWSQNPGWTASQVENQLYSSAENIDAYLSSTYIGKMGAGRINAYDAVNTGPPPPPVAAFSGSPTSGDTPLTVNFTDESTGSITSWSWTFGDGGSSTAQNPSHQYTSAGIYTVSLTVTGPGGSDGETKTDYITVTDPIPPPVAEFAGSPTSGEAPLTVNFTDQSTGQITSWSWTFGDGGTSTAQNPSHQYTSAGTFTVSLTVTGPGGSDGETKTNYITVTGPPPPVAAFSGSPTSGCAPLTVGFTDESTGDITSWSWTFGDGGTSTAQSPSHQYNSAGTYTVTLTVTGPGGSDSETKTNYITVTGAPVAAFTGSPTSGDVPLTVSFTDQSTGGATSWSWTFGDGGTSTAQNPTHEYTAVGTYTVTLTATNACGSDGETKTDYITVTEPGSVRAYALSDIPVSGTVTGSYESTHSSDDTSEDIRETETLGRPQTRYSYAEHKWEFSVAASSSATFYVEASRTANTDGDDFTFAYSTDDVTYTDLLTVGSETEQVYSAVISASLSGPVYIRVVDTDRTAGNRSKDRVYIDHMYIESAAGPVPPVADFSGDPTSGTAPLTVQFTDLSTGNPMSWSWDFGDGVGTSTEQNPSYTYANTGTYTVSLTASNAYGSDPEVKTDYITVSAPSPPAADFAGDPTSGTAPLAVQFTDLSTGSPTSWSWDFGDGVGTSTVQNPSYEYSSVGTYTVTLTASNAYGSDVETKVDYITVAETSYEMHVQSISVTKVDAGLGGLKRAQAIVTVLDAASQPVAGAAVTGNFSGLTTEAGATGVTDEGGQATILSAETVKGGSGEWCFEVTDVSHASYTYVPSQNNATMVCEKSGIMYARGVVTLVPSSRLSVRNSPNPFNPETEIQLHLPAAAHVRIEVFNVKGRRVAILADQDYGAGYHRVSWDASGQPPGIYFSRVSTGGEQITHKMILLK
jgi:PKD repeat protein